MHFVEQKDKTLIKKNRIENGISHTHFQFQRDEPYDLDPIRIAN